VRKNNSISLRYIRFRHPGEYGDAKLLYLSPADVLFANRNNLKENLPAVRQGTKSSPFAVTGPVHGKTENQTATCSLYSLTCGRVTLRQAQDDCPQSFGRLLMSQ
jgi:hypothetical protein